MISFLNKFLKRKKKIILIGIDGVPFTLLKDLIERGKLPFLGKKFKEGIFKEIYSPLPEISSVSWSTFMTGKNPGEHGIFGFTDVSNGYNLFFPNFASLRAEPIWEHLQEKDKKSVIINLPSTYPARRINGVLISGFVAVDLNRAVFPQNLLPYLNSIGYKVDVDNSLGKKNIEEFLKDLFDVLEKRFIVAKKLVKDINWDFFMLTITGSDRLHHFLFKNFLDENSPYHEEFIRYYKKIDDYISDFLMGIKNDYLLLMMSDHGFTEVRKEVFVNNILFENGFLKFKSHENRSFEGIDFSKTTAFALDPGRIYLNLRGRFERGKVDGREREKIVSDIKELFYKLNFEGEKIIKNIFEKEEIYEGSFLSVAPDIILQSEDGFDLKASFREIEIFADTHFQGMHTRENAFFYGDSEFEDLLINVKEVKDVGNLILDYFEV